MSLLRRIWSRITRPTQFVGTDLEGNRFYEYPSTTDDSRRTKRVVKYAKGRDMLHYIAGERRLPVQWMSWLTHTRFHPPTVQELQADLERQRRVLLNAAIIEARDREERARQQIQGPQETSILDNGAQSSTEAVTQGQAASGPPNPVLKSEPSIQQTQSSLPQDSAKAQMPASPWRRPSGAMDEPQPWSPSSVRRGGG
ncbi:hypothetical protein OBBRIDRAFT_781977 [Obba rivulosa]|uniref:NADH dehydrogenase [ubiquinone] 1 alpha subcomplex subunit 12 n=1 Tax=Obba rivulosa TaxID=1052685 RepID=A0A8E2DLU0_9APHY|nr:hypothetical protein OBBRIDRAFT_781977 [Obba rivulosa]